MLTHEQRAELEEHGPQSIRFKLMQHGTGRGASIPGFRCGDITRGDIEDWLIEKARIEATQQAATLRWAMIAGWAGIISAILTAAGIAIGFGWQSRAVMPFPSSEVVRLKDVLPVGAYPDHTSRRWWPPAEAQYRDWLTLMQAVVFIRADTAAVSFARNTKPDRKHLSHGPPAGFKTY